MSQSESIQKTKAINMARIEQGILGPFSGKVGEVITTHSSHEVANGT